LREGMALKSGHRRIRLEYNDKSLEILYSLGKYNIAQSELNGL